MTRSIKLLYESLSEWLATLWSGLRIGLPTPVVTNDEVAEGERGIDRDFEGWLHNDPMVTMNPASRYGDDATGFLAACDHESSTGGQFDD